MNPLEKDLQEQIPRNQNSNEEPKKIEFNFEEDPWWKDFDEQDKEIILRNMNPSNGLWGDSILIFSETGYAEIGMFEEINPLKTYEEYLREVYPKLADFVLKHSNQESVAALNGIINEFNSDLKKMKIEKNVEAVKNFKNRADIFIRGKNYDRTSKVEGKKI